MHFGKIILGRNVKGNKDEEDEKSWNKVSWNADVAQEHLIYPLALQGLEKRERTAVRSVCVCLKKPQRG